jgi:hypothetical protein
MKNILIVSDRYSVHKRLHRALVEDGWDVFDCPGPPFCGEEPVCGLAKVSDAVVLDTDVVGPVPAWTLVERYVAVGVPVVVLVSPEAAHAWVGDRKTTLLLRSDVDPGTLTRTLRDAIALRRLGRSADQIQTSPGALAVPPAHTELALRASPSSH